MKFIKAFTELPINRIFLMALFVGAGYYFVYFDTGETIEQQIAEVITAIAQEEARRGDINATMKKEEEMRGNVLQLKRNLEVVKSKIPNELKDAEMQSVINNAASASGVKITSLSTANTGNRDPNAPAVQINISEVRPENLIEEVRFRITLVGTFDSFLKFLETLGNEDKVIKVKNFDIKKASEDADEDRIAFQGEIIGFKQAKIEIVSGVK